MKIVLLSLFLFAKINCSNSTTVYICDSPNAKKYHYKESCRGLRDCSHRVVKMTLEQAQREGKTLCKWEK